MRGAPNGRLLVAFAFLHHTTNDAVGARQTQLAGLAQVGDAARGVAHRKLGQPTVEIGFDQLGVAADGLVIVGDGGAEVSARAAQVAAIEVGKGEIRSEADDLVILRDRKSVV